MEQEQQQFSEPDGEAAELELRKSGRGETAAQWLGLHLQTSSNGAEPSSPQRVEGADVSEVAKWSPAPVPEATAAELGEVAAETLAPSRLEAALVWLGLRPTAAAARPQTLAERSTKAAVWLRLIPASTGFQGYRRESGQLKLAKRVGWIVLAAVTGLLIADCALGLLAWVVMLVTALIASVAGQPLGLPWELLVGLPLVFTVVGMLAWLPFRLAFRALRSH